MFRTDLADSQKAIIGVQAHKNEEIVVVQHCASFVMSFMVCAKESGRKTVSRPGPIVESLHVLVFF